MAMVNAQIDEILQDAGLRRYEDAAGVVSVRRISWGAILAGSAVGLALQFWMAMLGNAMNVSILDPLQHPTGTVLLDIGSIVWLSITVLVSAFVGGWVTGRLAGIPRRIESALHAAASWAVATAVTFFFIGTALDSSWGIVLLMALGLGAGAAGATKAAPLPSQYARRP